MRFDESSFQATFRTCQSVVSGTSSTCPSWWPTPAKSTTVCLGSNVAARAVTSALRSLSASTSPT